MIVAFCIWNSITWNLVFCKELAWAASTRVQISELFCLIGIKNAIFEVFHFCAVCVHEQRKHFSIMLYLIIYCGMLLKTKVPQTYFWNRYDQVLVCIHIGDVDLYRILSVAWRWLCWYAPRTHFVPNNYHIFVFKRLRKYWWDGGIFFRFITSEYSVEGI